MTVATPPDAPFIEQQRLERAINWARWAGAALAAGLGPLFPNLGQAYVAALAVFLVAYGIFARWLFERVRTPAEQERVAQLSFASDALVVTFAMLIFSPDRDWTTFVVGVLLVITGAFRFGSPGALLAATLMSLAYVGLAAYRESAFGYVFEVHRVGFHVTVFLLAALLMTGILRELQTLRAQREAFLRAAGETQALREADRLKREFLAAVSHDFRTPLTVVRGTIELVLGQKPGPVTAAQRELLESAARNVRRLGEFTDELLEMAQLEEGRVALEPAEVDPGALLADVVTDHEMLAREKRQRVVLDLADPLGNVVADPRRLRQIVANLLSNAIHYSPKGAEIAVAATRQDRRLRIVVRDHGPGIAAGERSRIFDTFFRGRAADGTVGSGLGLAIARSLATLHGGTLEYEDTPGGGATFVLSIPFPDR